MVAVYPRSVGENSLRCLGTWRKCFEKGVITQQLEVGSDARDHLSAREDGGAEAMFRDCGSVDGEVHAAADGSHISSVGFECVGGNTAMTDGETDLMDDETKLIEVESDHVGGVSEIVSIDSAVAGNELNGDEVQANVVEALADVIEDDAHIAGEDAKARGSATEVRMVRFQVSGGEAQIIADAPYVVGAVSLAIGDDAQEMRIRGAVSDLRTEMR